MARYFSRFPKTVYSSSNTNFSVESVTNLISRFTIEQNLKNNTSAYYEYEIQDSDTPEIVAFKVYGSPERHWIILSFNNIVDPQFDWPLDYRSLNLLINQKYTANANTSVGETGLTWAQANIKSYYKIRTKTDNRSQIEKIEKYEVDANTYANVSVTTTTTALADGSTITIDISKETLTYYDYELEENEKKRNIKILKTQFVDTLEEELVRVFS